MSEVERRPIALGAVIERGTLSPGELEQFDRVLEEVAGFDPGPSWLAVIFEVPGIQLDHAEGIRVGRLDLATGDLTVRIGVPHALLLGPEVVAGLVDLLEAAVEAALDRYRAASLPFPADDVRQRLSRARARLASDVPDPGRLALHQRRAIPEAAFYAVVMRRGPSADEVAREPWETLEGRLAAMGRMRTSLRWARPDRPEIIVGPVWYSLSDVRQAVKRAAIGLELPPLLVRSVAPEVGDRREVASPPILTTDDRGPVVDAPGSNYRVEIALPAEESARDAAVRRLIAVELELSDNPKLNVDGNEIGDSYDLFLGPTELGEHEVATHVRMALQRADLGSLALRVFLAE